MDIFGKMGFLVFEPTWPQTSRIQFSSWNLWKTQELDFQDLGSAEASSVDELELA